MSKGINNGRKLLDYSIGTAGTFSFDINKYGHNLYGIIPLLSTTIDIPFSLSLVYNSTWNDGMFGRYILPSFFALFDKIFVSIYK